MKKASKFPTPPTTKNPYGILSYRLVVANFTICVFSCFELRAPYGHYCSPTAGTATCCARRAYLSYGSTP